jgi:septum site-determining protein MinD
MGKTIGVISLKGGVGKTSSVVALGSALEEMGKKVLMVDGNFSAPNLGLHLNVLEPAVTLHHVMDRSARISDAIYELSEKFHVLPASLFGKKVLNPLKLKDKLRTVKNKYDVTLIDSSPAMNEETLAAMLASDEVLVVTTPDFPTLSTTMKAVKLAKQRGTPIGGLILNKVHDKNFELSTDHIEETAGVPVLASVPHDINVMEAQSKFQSSVQHKPNSDSSFEFKKLAATLVGQKYQKKRFKDMFNIMKKISPERHEVNRELYYQQVFD